jgi:hypothetical protein
LTVPALPSITAQASHALSVTLQDASGVISLYQRIDGAVTSLPLPPRAPSASATVSTVVMLAGEGSHQVSFKATDCSGNVTESSQTVVLDTLPPVLSIAVTPSVIWPPDKRMVELTIAKTVSDAGDPHPAVTCTAASNEPGAGDVVIGPDGKISVRADRLGAGNGRTYTITCVATDSVGHASAPATATVLVPHDQGHH